MNVSKIQGVSVFSKTNSNNDCKPQTFYSAQTVNQTAVMSKEASKSLSSLAFTSGIPKSNSLSPGLKRVVKKILLEAKKIQQEFPQMLAAVLNKDPRFKKRGNVIDVFNSSGQLTTFLPFNENLKLTDCHILKPKRSTIRPSHSFSFENDGGIFYVKYTKDGEWVIDIDKNGEILEVKRYLGSQNSIIYKKEDVSNN